MRVKIYSGEASTEQTCDKLLVLDAKGQPIAYVLEVSPDVFVFSHCGDPNFQEHLHHFGKGLKLPYVKLYRQDDLQLWKQQ